MEFCEDKDSLYKREAELVTEVVLTDPMNMNLRLGGEGGWDYINSNSELQRSKAIRGNVVQAKLRESNPDFMKNRNFKASISMKQLWLSGNIERAFDSVKEERKQAILKSGVDFKSINWQTLLHEYFTQTLKIDISKPALRKFVKSHMTAWWKENCFIDVSKTSKNKKSCHGK